MSAFQTPISVQEAMLKINSREYLIPAFQREYVWDATRVENLFDSLMRGYPINSMLFWEVKGEARQSFVFYDFLSEYVEEHKKHNNPTNSLVKDSFYAILDGQQRLTSLYLGLYGTYAYHKKYRGWEYTEDNFPPRKLYLNLTHVNEETGEDDKKYLFEFKTVSETGGKDIFINEGEKWFRVGKSVDMEPTDIYSYITNNQLSKEELNVLTKLQEVICKDRCINYYLETSVQPNQAVNIFVRTNAGGRPLSISDILLSLTVAGWTQYNARDEFINLSDQVASRGFSIDHDYILKAFLCLFHTSVKNQISSFNTTFLQQTEIYWKTTKECILSLFDLLQSFGLDGTTIKSYNATLPILYYLYCNDKYTNYTTSVGNAADRDIVRKWLLKTILYRTFGSSADSVLQRAINELKRQVNQSLFPADLISKAIELPQNTDPQWVDTLLSTGKDDPYAFSILSLLYPNCNFATSKFDKDHLHPAAAFEEYRNNGGQLNWQEYNSIVNLQLLDTNSNKSKNATPLAEWVQNTLGDRPNLYAETYLPKDNSLSLMDFEDFYTKRKQLLAQKIIKELGYSI